MNAPLLSELELEDVLIFFVFLPFEFEILAVVVLLLVVLSSNPTGSPSSRLKLAAGVGPLVMPEDQAALHPDPSGVALWSTVLLHHCYCYREYLEWVPL